MGWECGGWDIFMHNNILGILMELMIFKIHLLQDFVLNGFHFLYFQIIL